MQGGQGDERRDEDPTLFGPNADYSYEAEIARQPRLTPEEVFASWRRMQRMINGYMRALSEMPYPWMAEHVQDEP